MSIYTLTDLINDNDRWDVDDLNDSDDEDDDALCTPTMQTGPISLRDFFLVHSSCFYDVEQITISDTCHRNNCKWAKKQFMFIAPDPLSSTKKLIYFGQVVLYSNLNYKTYALMAKRNTKQDDITSLYFTNTNEDPQMTLINVKYIIIEKHVPMYTDTGNRE
ncbi:hypothetical protein BC941DRAFT_475015 [Chlamydoabsidia padenii]|nr:hypothetical protein BC941DRAFT_475015 [Chlamydoabsidia padenii]